MAKIDLLVEKGPEFYDISFASDGDFATTDGLNTAIIMSLLEERRALPSEVPVATRRRGWWGNQFGEKVGFEIGSKLWLFHQARLTTDVTAKMRDAANDALTWMIDDNIAIDVNSEVRILFGQEARAFIIKNEIIGEAPDGGLVALEIRLTRPNGQVEFRFYDLWNNTK